MRAVLVGCGAQSEYWTEEMPAEVELVGFVDLDLDLARKRAEGREAVVDTDLGAVLRKTRPDAVFDCTVPEAHVKVTLQALEAGCHVLGEKPMANSMENARRMVAAASQAGRIYAVSQNYRYDRHLRRLKGLLPQLGPLTMAHMDFFMGPHFGGFRDRMAHPLLLDQAIHHFDAARFLLGADPVAVYCRAWNPQGSWYDGAATAVCTFEMSDGIVYTYRGSWCSEGLPTSWNGEWRIVGERGTATWTGDDASMAEVVTGEGDFFSEVKPVTPPPDEAGSEGLGAVLAEFIRSVETGASPETVCTDNIKSLAMAFGAIESARTGMRELIET